MPVELNEMTNSTSSHLVNKPQVMLGAGGKELPAPYK
jgi:hypothetical protein